MDNTKLPNKLTFAASPRTIVYGMKRSNAIGIVSPSYGMEKMSYGLKPVDYEFFKLVRVPVHRLEKRGTFLRQTPIVLDYPVELVHTFNEIPLGQRPYVISYEIELPRYLGTPSDWQLRFGFEALSQDRCRGLLAMSQAASEAFKVSAIAAGFPNLQKKVSVFRGSVMPFAAAPRMHTDGGRNQIATAPLRVLFVGRDAYRKGLLPALDALEDCVKSGCNIHATIVSDFTGPSYVGGDNALDAASFRKRVNNKAHITHIESASNAQIHAMMMEHDVFLFPSLDEGNGGWVTVEAGMSSMPIITTDVFAIPELVIDGINGAVIRLNKGDDSRWIGLHLKGEALRQEIETTFSQLRVGIRHALLRFASDRTLSKTMGAASRHHLNKLFDYQNASDQLRGIYTEALK
jgi:glycosyltransferase involved in cell wall biosynthesis